MGDFKLWQLPCDKVYFSSLYFALGYMQKTPVVSLPLRKSFFAFYRDIKYQHFHLQIQYLVLKSRANKLLKWFIMKTILRGF